MVHAGQEWYIHILLTTSHISYIDTNFNLKIIHVYYANVLIDLRDIEFLFYVSD